MDETSCDGQGRLPSLRELEIQNLIHPGQVTPRPALMTDLPARRPMIQAHPNVMEIGLSPPGPSDTVRFPTMDSPNRHPFQSFGTRFESFDPWSMPPLFPYTTQMGGYLGQDADPNNPSSAQRAPHSDMGDTGYHSQGETSRSMDPQSTKPAPSPGPSRPAPETSFKGPEPVTPKSELDNSNERVEKSEAPAPKRQKSPQKLPKQVVTKFEDIPAHTAKCDACNQRNSKGMTRCAGCGWQLCQGCRQKRGGDLTHSTFDCEHTEAQHLRSAGESLATPPASNRYETPAPQTPEEVAASILVGRYQTPVPPSPEENAAGILLEMSSSPTAEGSASELSFARARSEPSTPTPAARNNPPGVRAFADDSDEIVSAPSSIDLDGTLTPHDWVRRNPTRNARPPRARFD